MNVQTLAAALIASWEACRLTAFQDPGGVWTIGYGRTQGVKEGDICTQAQAIAWFSDDLAPLVPLVKQEPLVAAAAYMSFGYNCGRAALELVLAGKGVLTHFVHDKHGNVLSDLERRRNAEQSLIDSVSPISA